MLSRCHAVINDILLPMSDRDIITWKKYTITIIEVWLAFCIATFSLLVFMANLSRQPAIIAEAVLLAILYLFIVFVCIRRLVQRLSVAALMIMVPIAPLAVLLLVVSLLPVIQQLQY